MIPFIDLQKQRSRISDSIDKRINEVLSHGKFIMGPEVKELEKLLEDYTEAKYCIACANGTDALQLALMAVGVGPGDEVITTPFTFVSTVETICLLGAKPVYVDIDPRTFNIDANLIERAVSPKTKAIIPVSLYGQCPDFDAINALADQHGFHVIEDAAQSFGATYKKRKSCNLSTLATTSFFPSKPLGGYGDGGALFTSSEELADRLRKIRVHGQSARYQHQFLGVNSRLDSLQAGILIEKMKIFPDEVELRQSAAERYKSLLGSEFVTPFVEEHNLSVFAQYTLRVERREELQAELKSLSVPTAVHYPKPLHLQEAFKQDSLGEGSFPESEKASKEVISIPFHPYISESDQQKVAEAMIQTKRSIAKVA